MSQMKSAPAQTAVRSIAATLEPLEDRRLYASVTAKAADKFVDMIGINTHTSYSTSAYGDDSAAGDTKFNTWKQKIYDLGVRHLRDNFTYNDYTYYRDRLTELANHGVPSTFTPLTNATDTIAAANALGTNVVEGFEGQNEIINQNNGSTTTDAAVQAAVDKQISLYNAVNGNSTWASTPVLALTTVGNVAGRIREVTGDDLHAYSDYSNVHSYPLGQSPESNLQAAIDTAQEEGGTSQPVIATETGYQNGNNNDGNQPVSEAASAEYTPRLMLEYFRRGIYRTFDYELLNLYSSTTSRESNFGLIRNDFSEKPAFKALKNTISLFNEGTFNATTHQWTSPSFTPGSLDYTISAPSTVHSTLLQKSDGSFYLALWNAVSNYNTSTNADISNATVSATITFASSVQSGTTVYTLQSDGSRSADTTKTISGGSLTLNVPDRLMIVKINKTAGATIRKQTYDPPAAKSSASHSVFSDAAADGGTATSLNATGTSDYVTYAVNNIAAGDYTLRVRVKTGPDRGKFQLSHSLTLGGTSYLDGSAQDLYSTSFGYTTLDLGTITITSTGTRYFKFDLTGKNAASSGYKLVLDYIELVAA